MGAVCSRGHENPQGSKFCNDCGEPLDQSSRPVAAETTMADSPASIRPTGASRRGRLLVVGAALAAVVFAIGGAVLVKQVWDGRVEDRRWDSALNKPGASAEVEEGVVTFGGVGKTDCDTDDYQTTEWIGSSSYESTDWDAYEACQDAAELVFGMATMGVFEDVEAFAKKVGLPSSFKAKLERLRGLDGQQVTVFEDTEVGRLEATYSYDGGNGLFVQFERPD